LRAANLRIMGSGQGSVTTATIIAQLPALAAEITAGTLMVNAAPLPLSRVEAAWNASTAPGQRIVFTPEPPTVEYRHRPRRRLAAALLSHRPGAPVAPAKTASA
jgi:hypothetical protein